MYKNYYLHLERCFSFVDLKFILLTFVTDNLKKKQNLDSKIKGVFSINSYYLYE